MGGGGRVDEGDSICYMSQYYKNERICATLFYLPVIEGIYNALIVLLSG